MDEGPETIIWIVTSRCNLNCRHCYTLPYRFERDLDTNIVKKIIEEAADVGVEHIHYTGGEPLLRNDIFDILKRTIELGIDIKGVLVILQYGSRVSKESIQQRVGRSGRSDETFRTALGLLVLRNTGEDIGLMYERNAIKLIFNLEIPKIPLPMRDRIVFRQYLQLIYYAYINTYGYSSVIPDDLRKKLEAYILLASDIEDPIELGDVLREVHLDMETIQEIYDVLLSLIHI